ncbi:hypothetical protein ME789_18010 [Lactobacillus delbrueckii]|nr:hypothetical protein ME789_18010 [Lactobacillus delbrueckii]
MIINMGEKQLNNVLDAKTGVKDTLPTMLGYVGIGTAFGIIAHTNGFSPLETFIMSLLVYTASGEFAVSSPWLACFRPGAVCFQSSRPPI